MILYEKHDAIMNFANAIGSEDESLSVDMVMDMLARALSYNKASVFSLLKKHNLVKDKEYSSQDLFYLMIPKMQDKTFQEDLFRMLMEINASEFEQYKNGGGGGADTGGSGTGGSGTGGGFSVGDISGYVGIGTQVIGVLGGLFGGGSGGGSGGGTKPSGNTQQTYSGQNPNATNDMLAKLKMYQAMNTTPKAPATSSNKTLIIVTVSLLGVAVLATLFYIALKGDKKG